RPAVVGVVRLALACHRDDGAVMKVVVPHRVETVAAGIDGTHELRRLRLALGHENNRTAACGVPRPAADLAEDVPARAVVNRLRGVKTQTIELKLVYPVGAVVREVIAHGLRVGAVEVQGVAP